MSFPKKSIASKRSLSDSETCSADAENIFRINLKTQKPNFSDKTTIAADEPKQKDSKLPDEAPNEEAISRKATEEASIEKHSTGEQEKTKETTESEKNDILEEILRSSPSSSDELEKVETLEISIEDSNLDGCDEEKKLNKSDKSKGSSRLEEGEREEGELTPDHHCSVDEVTEVPEVKNSQEKENVPKENLQDILGTFYTNAKQFMETQNDYLKSSLLARLNWIIRHVEDVKGEISKDDLFCKVLKRSKRSGSATRQGTADVNRSRISNRKSRSVTTDRTHGANNGQTKSSNVLSSKQPNENKSHGLDKRTRSGARRSPSRRHPDSAETKEPLQRDPKLHRSKDGQPRKGDVRRHSPHNHRERSSRLSRADLKAESDKNPPDLDTRKEARETRHTKKREEQNRMQSLVKRQMRIISHIVKKQNKGPLKKEADAWSRYHNAILLDDQQRSKEMQDSKPQSAIRDRPLNNLDDMETFLDDLRSKNRNKNAGRGDPSQHLSTLYKELAHLTNVFEGNEQFLSRDDMDIYKYKYTDEKPKQSMVFTSRKKGRKSPQNHVALKVIGDETKLKQDPKNIDEHSDGNWRLLKSRENKVRQSPPPGIARDEIKENVKQSASEQRALKRKALLDEKNEILQKVSEKRQKEEKSNGEELYNPSDVTNEDSIPENREESKTRDGNKRSDRSSSLESSAESDEELRRLEKTRQLSESENSDSAEDEPHGKRIAGGNNEISRKERVSSPKRRPKSHSTRKIRKRVKEVSPPPPRLLKSRSRGGLKSHGGRRIILADKNLAGRICLQLKSGHIILANDKEALGGKRRDKLRPGKKIRKNLRQNEREFRPESERNGKKKRRGETTLEEMESFLGELRERKEVAARVSGDEQPAELFPPAYVHAKEAKFLDRVRAKRKAKLMACLDLDVSSSRQTVAKEAKCLADMNKRVCDDSEDEDDSSVVNEKDKSELLQKLKAETKAILLGNKSKPREMQRPVSD